MVTLEISDILQALEHSDINRAKRLLEDLEVQIDEEGRSTDAALKGFFEEVSADARQISEGADALARKAELYGREPEKPTDKVPGFSRIEERLLALRDRLDPILEKSGGIPEDDGSIDSALIEDGGEYEPQEFGGDVSLPGVLLQTHEKLRAMEKNMREREECLRKKESELKVLEARVLGTDGVETTKLKGEKVSTGVRRLDDMLYGGLPKRSQVMVYGPPFSGTDVLLNAFVVDGLKRGMPAIYVVTDKTPEEVLESMSLILPNAQEHLEKGKLMFVDAYSKIMGLPVGEKNVFCVEHAGNLEAIAMAVENAQKSITGEPRDHKLAFHSLSTLIAYKDPMSVFRFMQSLVARCKRDGTTALYLMDAGMHSDAEVQTLKRLMSGMIEFETDDLKNFLRVDGIHDARTRAWV